MPPSTPAAPRVDVRPDRGQEDVLHRQPEADRAGRTQDPDRRRPDPSGSPVLFGSPAPWLHAKDASARVRGRALKLAADGPAEIGRVDVDVVVGHSKGFPRSRGRPRRSRARIRTPLAPRAERRSAPRPAAALCTCAPTAGSVMSLKSMVKQSLRGLARGSCSPGSDRVARRRLGLARQRDLEGRAAGRCQQCPRTAAARHRVDVGRVPEMSAELRRRDAKQRVRLRLRGRRWQTERVACSRSGARSRFRSRRSRETRRPREPGASSFPPSFEWLSRGLCRRQRRGRFFARPLRRKRAKRTSGEIASRATTARARDRAGRGRRRDRGSRSRRCGRPR